VSCSPRSGTRSAVSKGIPCTVARSRTRWACARRRAQELVWDRRALAAADLLTDARMAQAGVMIPAAGLYPSVHLNLSACYRKLGDLGRAREHLQQAQATIGALGDDGYAQMIREGMERLTEQLRRPDSGDA
jgi:hypothetical protein